MTKPYFALSKRKVLEQYNKIKQLCDVVSYSSKTNQDVTKILEAQQESKECMFSVHFVNELQHITDCSRVIFLAQAWTQQEIRDLINAGISWFVVDNESDLDKLLNYVEYYDVQITLLLRMKIRENTLKTERYFVFGMTSDVINRRIKEISENQYLKGKINQLGIHFHRKTQNMSEWNLQYELSQILDKDVLEKISWINIGGGLPSEYANTNAKVVEGIFNKITELRQWLSAYNIRLIIEPGRFIAASSAKLVTNIIAIHQNTIIVNASVYNSDMDAVIVPVKLLIQSELTKEEAESKNAELDKEDIRAYAVKGITPCSMDLFRYKVYLKEPKIGDEIIFLNAGAYNFTTDFCDLEKLETKVIE